MSKKLILVFGVIIFLGVTTSATYVITKNKGSQVSQPPDLSTQTLVGKVTRINRNGRDYIIDENGAKAPGSGYGIADVADLISVDGQTFSTSSGNSSAEDSFYINTKSINLGDEVIVRYATTESGEKTLNCKGCSVEKRLHTKDGKPFDKEPSY